MLKVVVTGADGRMGREVVKAVLGEEDIELVGAVDRNNQGQDIGTLAVGRSCGVPVTGNLGRVLEETGAHVVVDFTTPANIRENIAIMLQHKVNAVIGTTGLSGDDIAEIDREALEAGVGVLIAPNFAIGAVLMMKFAAEAARYLPHVEIIELHHDRKLDAPSGTAVKTAELIKTQRESFRQGHPEEHEKFSGVRGGDFDGMRVHSIRLPGLVAHQEVIFGGLGQTLRIKHDSISRESFMPGVILAVRKVTELKGVTYGLEKLLTE
ncbi:MAG: 4-hydroxy-tetrahydrodipicolinate reductase [Firmicutes bacterium HGW-Firmicutes-14]|nr:MAG: 4-hydroxy-tetrahydrodipicolinate reductase [Firmicutes bacterium HGW-Firmicutes-14]